MKKSVVLISGLALSAVVLACAMRPMPPFKVDVSLWDMAVAWAQGYTNPSHAAFLSNLDDQGRETFGAAWRTDNFVGYVYPKVSLAGASGATQIFIDKPCNSEAVDGATTGSIDSGGSGGAGGGEGGGVGGVGSGGGGGDWGPGPGGGGGPIGCVTVGGTMYCQQV